MNKLLKISLAASVFFAATSANATTFVFDTTKAGTGSTGTTGNSMTYTAKTGAETLSMKATGWNLAQATGSFWGFTYGLGYNVVGASQLTSYSAGLGVVSPGDSASNATHTIDNAGRTDFVLLQFSQPVTLKSAALNTFSIDGGSPDADATIGWGSTTGAWDQSLPLNGTTQSAFNSYLTGTAASSGTTSGTRTLNLGAVTGNLWMISAAQLNPDCLVDGFKLAGLTVNTVSAVPEPATWAMMLVGFGMVGAATRVRRRKTTVSFA
ncbi:hypothetical protein ASG67_10850 [Sphingomonas sp. Leaf339]|uniref:PEPxxWA-CTERM sorting domain-containing protein n=1 Tax=Sphingomonas sp. Leaf339 TaxID=1736343 RepID=UPI0006FE9900|nr:PEPxxWA-CTERM sorting domain-containing protein [Sphingomonas sp. Leaf339]KQU49620.1 hypothetical protein ASG67_10850 [Sphingomonas sp. Leaf339]